MEFDEYKKKAMKTAIYPKETGLYYAALGLASEAGEVAGKVKKVIRDSDGVVNAETREKISAEIGDCLWYCAAMANEISYSLDDIAKENIVKLQKRKEEGKIKGSGDNR